MINIIGPFFLLEERLFSLYLSPNQDLIMAAPFDPVNKQVWLEKVTADLKGRAIEELTWTLPEGIEISPFANAEENYSGSPILKQNNQWGIGERIHLGGDLKEANLTLLDLLEKGINSPLISIRESLSVESIKTLLSGVHLDFITIGFEGLKGAELLKFWAHFEYFLEEEYQNKSVSWWLDATNEIENSEFWEKVKESKTNSPDFRIIDGSQWFGDREKVLQELVNSTNQFLSVLNIASSFGVALDSIIHRIYWSLQVGTSYFLEIAKIRAVRHLIANTLQGFGLEGVGLPKLDVSFAPTAYTEEIHTNKIRATSLAMSAIIAGADRLTILSSDANDSSDSDPFNQRVARNVQLVLMLESHLDHVVDPAAGSYYIESLTQKLAEKAWKQL